MALAEQSGLVERLRETLADRTCAGPVRKLETHISYVLLTGRWAYKIKKAVKLGFLDFSTLERRRFYCLEELRLNRRHAPRIYAEVVPIAGSAQSPELGGAGTPIEYAVKMREFAQEDLASRLLARGQLSAADMDLLAQRIAAFHASCETIDAATAGRPADTVLLPATDNFLDIGRLMHAAADRTVLQRIERWTGQEFAALGGAFAQRIADGRVRECHGDLHLENIARVDGELTPFDCIEFSAALRRIDVISEVAFLAMDLEAHGRIDLARRFLNQYLEHTGDYAGLAVLRFYVVYRAMVRAKIALLSRKSPAGPETTTLPPAYHRYIGVAARWAQPARAGVILMHGLSGSGKSTVAGALVGATGAVRLRSDVERKRLASLGPRESSNSLPGSGLYAGDMTEATYDRLLGLMQQVQQCGHTVIVDATFLARGQRQKFSAWARANDVPLVVLSLAAPQTLLRERVNHRSSGRSDASEATAAVLDHQLENLEPLAPDELVVALVYDAAQPVDEQAITALGRVLLGRLGIPPGAHIGANAQMSPDDG